MNEIGLLLALFGLGSQGEKLTLDEALRIAEANAFAVKVAQSNVEKTRQKINELRAGLGPQVNINSTYTRFDRESTGTGGIVFSPIDQTLASIDFKMPVDITGTLSRGVNAARVALRAAEELVGAERNDLRELVRRAFFDVLRSEAQVGVAEESLRNANERLDVTRKEFDAGTKAKIDVLRIETQVRQNEADLLAAQNNVRLSKQTLNNTMARPIETPFEPVDITVLPKVSADADTLVALAHRQRPDIVSGQFNLQALALIRRSQEGGMAPSLDLTARHNRNLGDPGFGGRKESTTAVLGLSIPVFDSGITRARVKQARQDEEQGRLNLEQLKLGVSLEVRRALSNLTDANSRLEVAQKSVELASETYRLTKIRYDNDEAIQLEVVDAQTELTRAQSQLVAARYEYLTAYAALQRAVAADDLSALNGGRN